MLDLGLFWTNKSDVKFSRVFGNYKSNKTLINIYLYFYELLMSFWR